MSKVFGAAMVAASIEAIDGVDVPTTTAQQLAAWVLAKDHEQLRRQRDELLAALVKLHMFLDFEEPLEPGEWGVEDPSALNAAMAEAHEIIRKATGQD